MTCRGALFHPSQTPDVAGQPDRASEGGRSLSGPATSGRTPSSLDLLLAEIGRVHLFGWERNPRDESKDGQPRHVEGACRKCSLLRQDDAVRQQIWMLRDPKKAEHQLACQTHLNGGICTCGATQQSADLNDAQEGTP